MRSAPRAVKPEFRRDLRLHRGRAQNMDAPRRRTRVNPTAHATVAAPFPRVGPPRADQVPAALHAPRPPRSSFAGSTRSRRSAYRSQRRKGPASQSRKTVTDTFAGAGTSRGRNRHARAHGRVGRSAATSRHRHRTRPSRCLFTPGNRRRAGRSGSAAPEVFPTSTSSRPPRPAPTGRKHRAQIRVARPPVRIRLPPEPQPQRLPPKHVAHDHVRTRPSFTPATTTCGASTRSSSRPPSRSSAPAGRSTVRAAAAHAPRATVHCSARVGSAHHHPGQRPPGLTPRLRPYRRPPAGAAVRGHARKPCRPPPPVSPPPPPPPARV